MEALKKEQEAATTTNNPEAPMSEEATALVALKEQLSDTELINKATRPTVTLLKELQSQGERAEDIKSSMATISDTVNSEVKKALQTFKAVDSDLTSKDIINMFFNTVISETQTDDESKYKNHTKGVISLLRWYYLECNFVIKKEFVTLEALKTLKKVAKYTTKRKINDLLKYKLKEDYKKALEAVLNDANELKTLCDAVATLSANAQSKVLQTSFITSIKRLDNGKVAIKFEASLLSDAKAINEFKALVKQELLNRETLLNSL